MVGRQMESHDLALTMTGPAPEESTADSAQALERAMGGDRAAFDELLRCYERRVLMTAWRILGSKEDAQDAAQEVFLRLYRQLQRVDPKRPLMPWLYRMTCIGSAAGTQTCGWRKPIVQAQRVIRPVKSRGPNRSK